MKDIKTIITITCDRCKSIIKDKEPVYPFIMPDDNYENYRHAAKKDLCENCNESLKKWWDNKNV